VIEPANAYCFQTDPREPPTGVHARRLVWIPLELARGARDNFRMHRDPGAILNVAAEARLAFSKGAAGFRADSEPEPALSSTVLLVTN
jgi:hypothetical protein